MGNEKDIYYCELSDSFTEEQKVEQEAFLDSVAILQIDYGYTSNELKEFLIKEIESRPYNYYAYHYLYNIYLIEMKLEKAREVAWKLISLNDCSFFRNYLVLLEDLNYIYIKVYIFGDKSILPKSVIDSLEENEGILKFNELMKRK